MSSILLLLLLLLHSFFIPSSSLDFIFNSNFNSTNILTFGNATVQSSILTITDAAPFSLGRAFYPSPIPTTITNSSSLLRPFHTSFIFSIVPPARPLLPGHGFAFLFSPVAGIRGATSSQHMGLFNLTNDGNPSNRVFAVEFDVFRNQEFNDLDDNHVGVDVNSLTSVFQSKGIKEVDEEEGMEDWEMEYWPHRIDYRVIHEATGGFEEENVIGYGGNGKVYRGRLDGGMEVAVKRISLQNQHGTREFLAEVSSLGRLKHRNLVSIKGWCKKEKGSLILVYEYMENGSLDRKIFHDDDSVLNWEDRMRILTDAARGILYLHEGWEVTVLHRDIKASNVLLDKEMNARLGDFGLAKMHQHGVATSTTMTQVVGTVGYMAPEMVTTGRASTQTDVFSFGVLMLEVICGRRPVEQGKPSLVDMVRKVMDKGDVISVVDSRVKARGGFEDEEVERMVRLALLCTYGDPKVRPTMRQVVKALERGNESQIDDALEANLLDRAGRNNGLWSGYYHHGFNGAEHLTFDNVLQSFPSSVSLLSSDAVAEGR
ncbi:Probable L-type lectin-domain containing receptor kinase VII.2 [Linum perenne]